MLVRPADTPRTRPRAEHGVLPDDPVRPWTGLAVGDLAQPVAELGGHHLEHLFGAAQRNAADQQHAPDANPSLCSWSSTHPPVPGHAGCREGWRIARCHRALRPAVERRRQRRTTPGRLGGEGHTDRVSPRVTSPVLVGRGVELAELRAALDHARAGAGGLVLVDGEAGIGKSRLLEEFAPGPRRRGRVLAGCVSALRRRRSLRAVRPDPRLTSSAATTPRRSPRRPTRPIASASSAWVADQLVAASRQPLVVVVEDVHWADESTGDLLLFVSTAVRRRRIVVVAARRPSEARGSAACGRSRRVVRSGERVQVPTSAARRRRDRRADRSARRRRPIPGCSTGSPTGPRATRSSSRSSSPPAVGPTCRRRSATSSSNASPASTASTQQLLRVAAVIGRRFSYALLREVADVDSTAIDAALREAVRQQLMVASRRSRTRSAMPSATRLCTATSLPGERAPSTSVSLCLAAHPSWPSATTRR